jgi:hypothetical protein
VAGADEIMHQHGLVAHHGSNTRDLELGGIGGTIIMQGVKPGGHEEGRGEVCEIPRQQGQGHRIVTTPMQGAKSHHIGGRKPGCLGLRDVGAACHVAPKARRDQHLPDEATERLIPHLVGQCGGKCCA